MTAAQKLQDMIARKQHGLIGRDGEQLRFFDGFERFEISREHVRVGIYGTQSWFVSSTHDVSEFEVALKKIGFKL